MGNTGVALSVGRVVVVGRISPNPGWVNGFVVDDPQATSHPNTSSKQIKRM
jgi:hypothetical protein